MVAKRIIPCLDVKDSNTVKGVNFENLRYVGDPVELGKFYSGCGADELVYLDISATNEGRRTFVKLVKKVAANLNIPFTVGGGIATIEDASLLLDAGADKISVNSAALRDSSLIEKIAGKYGSQFVVVAIDAKQENGTWRVMSNGGKRPAGKELFTWAKEAESMGAGEILFTSMDHDGTKSGFACSSLERLCGLVSIPVIASGGAGNMEHFLTLFRETQVDAALAASVFHEGKIEIMRLKEYLNNNLISVRL